MTSNETSPGGGGTTGTPAAPFGRLLTAMVTPMTADGAVDVVAHPARYRDKDRTKELLLHATGIEAYTSRHKGEVGRAYRAFAEVHKKHWTASTDDVGVTGYLVIRNGSLLGRASTTTFTDATVVIRADASKTVVVSLAASTWKTFWT
jgi:hypothetical protein